MNVNERQSGFDRRAGKDRRSGLDTRSEEENRRKAVGDRTVDQGWIVGPTMLPPGETPTKSFRLPPRGLSGR